MLRGENRLQPLGAVVVPAGGDDAQRINFHNHGKKKRLLADPGTGYPSVTVPGMRKLVFDRGREVLLSRDAQRARLRIREVVRAHIL